MKILFITSILFSFNAFAIDFNKVTGSFDVVTEKKSDEVAHVTAITGSYEKATQKYEGRMPASTQGETDKQESINEVTGTFR